jgi:hypothetical protein
VGPYAVHKDQQEEGLPLIAFRKFCITVSDMGVDTRLATTGVLVFRDRLKGLFQPFMLFYTFKYSQALYLAGFDGGH